MVIKDTFLFQFFKSKFRLDFSYNYLIGLTQKVDPIFLDIKYKNLEKLAANRNAALKTGVLIRSEDDYVDAVLSNKEGAVDIDLRLKGDWTDHLNANKWSLE